MQQQAKTQNDRDVAVTNAAPEISALTFAPAVDIFEKAGNTVLIADMPGVAQDDIDVTLERQILTLRGKVRRDAPDGHRPVSTEYREGDYQRVFTLSEEIDQARILAEFKNGVLRLELPRAAKAEPKKIAVKAI